MGLFTGKKSGLFIENELFFLKKTIGGVYSLFLWGQLKKNGKNITIPVYFFTFSGIAREP